MSFCQFLCYILISVFYSEVYNWMEVTVEVYSFKCIDFPVYTTTVHTKLETDT